MADKPICVFYSGAPPALGFAGPKCSRCDCQCRTITQLDAGVLTQSPSATNHSVRSPPKMRTKVLIVLFASTQKSPRLIQTCSVLRLILYEQCTPVVAVCLERVVEPRFRDGSRLPLGEFGLNILKIRSNLQPYLLKVYFDDHVESVFDPDLGCSPANPLCLLAHGAEPPLALDHGGSYV
jgi:hypothetical protein